MKKFVIGYVFVTIYFILNSCNTNKPASIVEEHIGLSQQSPVQKKSIVEKLKEDKDLSIDEIINLYHQLKQEKPELYNFENEDELTMLGYSFMWANEVTKAIEVFKLIVKEFPKSSNSYDSLGEAYLASGNKELSLLNYEKSLAMNPDNFNAEDQIEKIKYPDKIQITPNEKFEKIYSKSDYINDLDQMGKKLFEIHPNVFKFTPKAAFLEIIEKQKSRITDHTTFGEFAWLCSEIISAVNCSHTSIGSFYLEDQMLETSLTFPIVTRWINDKLYVIDPLNNSDNVSIKDEVISINGMPTLSMMNEIYKHIPSQGFIETTKRHVFNTRPSTIIPFALGFPSEYEITIKGKEKAIKLNPAQLRKNMFDDGGIHPCPQDLCLDIIEPAKTALLSIRSFNYYPWNNLTVFQEFIDSSFNVINKNGIENLIIDVRQNGGGSSESSIHLLKYLVGQPFKYFSRAEMNGKPILADKELTEIPFDNSYKGKLYFLIDGFGNSTTGHFMSLVKVLNLGTIVGEELGSNQFCTGGQVICRLNNTKMLFYIANNTHVSTATSLPDEKGILPDYYISQNLEEYLNKVDVVKNFTLDLIHSKK